MTKNPKIMKPGKMPIFTPQQFLCNKYLINIDRFTLQPACMAAYYNFLNVLKNIIGELCDFLSSKDIIKFIHTYMYVVFSSICHFQIL